MQFITIPAAIGIIGGNFCVFRHTELFIDNFCDLRVYLRNINMGLGVSYLHIAGKGIASSSNGKALERLSSCLNFHFNTSAYILSYSYSTW